MTRREIVRAGAAAAAGLLVGCNRNKQTITPAATFDVLVHFSGLFALAATPSVDKACVLFLDATKASIDPHFAVLKVAAANHGTETPDGRDPYSNLDIWALDKYHVDFGQTGNCKPMTSTATCPEVDKKKLDWYEEWHDIQWIANLSKALASGDAKVNPDFVKPTDLTNTVVQTRIPLLGGAIGADYPRDKNAQIGKFTLIDGDYAVTQPMSDVVLFRIPNLTSFTITLTAFSGAAKTIAVQPSGTGGAVHVWLENLASPGSMGNLKDHFMALSDLRKSYTKRPYPANGVYCVSGKSLPEFPVYCPPALIEYSE